MSSRRLSWHLAGLLLALAGWVYMLEVRHPSFKAQAGEGGIQLTEYYTDLYPRWRGAVELLWHGRDPYSWEVTSDIHLAMTGEQLAPGHIVDNFYYPLHLALVLAPLTIFPYLALMPWLYAAGFALLLLALLCWIRFIGGAVNKWGIFIVGMGSVPAIDAVSIQQPLILSVVCLAGGMAAIAKAGKAAGEVDSWYILAGALLALGTIKPQTVIPLMPLVFLWATGDLRRRWGIYAGFGATLAILLLGAEVLSPGWIPRWLEAVAGYGRQTSVSALLMTILPMQLAWVTITAGALALTALAWQARGKEADHPSFKLLVAAALLASYLVFPSWLYQQLLLYPAVLLIIYALPGFPAAERPARLLRSTLTAIVLWPMLLAAVGGLLWLSGHLLAQPLLLSGAWALQPAILLPLVLLPLLLVLLLTSYGISLRKNPARGILLGSQRISR